MDSRKKITESIRAKALELGFDVCGFARAQQVSDKAISQYSEWIADGKNDIMDYAERYQDLRNNPCTLFPGAKTVICVAMNYYPAVSQHHDAPQFARYAYGKDYHDIIRQRLSLLNQFISDNWGAQSRICVDTAPIMEKYWAREAGIGFIGRNNLLIIPGKGSFFFLGELITPLELTPDEPCSLSCGNCNRCVESCPANALHDERSLDARRCLSCQLIERRGDLPHWIAEVAGNRIYGCDSCQFCCPHNSHATPTTIEEFRPSSEFLNLSLNDIVSMTPETFKAIFGKSAVKRAKLEGLQRNAQLLKSKKS